MTISKSYVGLKYYTYDENGILEIVRVVNDKDTNSMKCIILEGDTSDKKRKISKDELDDKYTKIRPDGIIYFNTAIVGEIEDVIVMMYRSDDIDHAKSTPYLVCRQNITDLFANTINPNYNNLITGVAVSEDSLPDGLTMDTVLACDGIGKSAAISVYIDDNLNDIISLIKTTDYDNILYNLFVDHIRYKYKDNQKDYIKKDIVDGYSKSLRNLLEDNEFMYEFCRGFNIYPLNMVISKDEIGTSLTLSHRLTLSTILMRNITHTFVAEFNKFIDLDKINGSYTLIKDTTDKLYIVAYTYSGSMRVPVEKIESPENIRKLSNIPGWQNAREIKDAIRFNTKKYQ